MLPYNSLTISKNKDKMSTVSLIVAVADNYAIGNKQELLCRMPNDMKRFKELTTGNTVIMGRKTFESLPKGALPNRTNIVLTSSPDTRYPDTLTCTSIQAALESSEKEKEIFIIGGASVYKEGMAVADKMYLTWIHHSFEEADTFFPEIDFTKWEETERKVFPADEKHLYPYTFSTYVRKK